MQYERIIARLRAQFEELRNLRTTEAESALASARRTWEARISAQQSVLDHLRQELHDTKEELTAVRSHSRRGFSSKNNADYRVMEEQLENVKAENDELRRQRKYLLTKNFPCFILCFMSELFLPCNSGRS